MLAATATPVCFSRLAMEATSRASRAPRGAALGGSPVAVLVVMASVIVDG